MNVRYKTITSTTSKIHYQSFIHSSFVRRTSSDYILFSIHPHTLLLILILFCYNLCPALENQFDKVPSIYNLTSLSRPLSKEQLNLSSTATTNKSFSLLSNHHDQSNEYRDQKLSKLTSFSTLFDYRSSSTISFTNKSFSASTPYYSTTSSSFNQTSTSPSYSLESKNLYNKHNLFVDRSVYKTNRSLDVDRLRKSGKETEFLINDKSDLFRHREHNFLNLIRVKLKRRDQRNLDHRNDSINLIRLINKSQLNDTAYLMSNYLNDNLKISYFNISDLYQNYLKETDDAYQNQMITTDHLKTGNLEISNLEATASTLTKGSLTMVVSMSILYIIIFFTGVLGNLGTCIVILKNKYMRTATNYYLFSLSVSDLTLLLVGLPQDIFLLWRPHNYPFGEAFCVLRGFTSEASSNASVLTITAFTIERYLAICQPLRAHTMSKLNRVVKLVCLIWIASAVFALPLALQFGINYDPVQLNDKGPSINAASCTITKPIRYSFEMSTIVFFVIPLCLLTVLYIKIGVHLRRSEKCITRQHVNTQHSQSNLSPVATINAPPSSPNSNACPIVIDSDQASTDDHRRNSKEESMITPSNLLRKMVRSCSNSSLRFFKSNPNSTRTIPHSSNSSLSLKLNSPQFNSNQLNTEFNLNQTNSQPNFQSLSNENASEHQTTKKLLNNNSISLHPLTKQQSVESIVVSNKNNQIDCSMTKIENESKSLNTLSEDGSGKRNKLMSRLKNVIEEKDGEELGEEDTERMSMLAVKDEESFQNSSVRRVDIPTVNKSKNSSKNSKDINNKRKQFQKMSPFSTLDSSSSNGLSKSAGLSTRTNTALHSQDSSASLNLNVRRKNWRFFKNRHSTRTIHHSSSSRRAVLKMLVAVVVSFFVCWSFFHTQRIFASLIKEPTEPQIIIHNLLTNISGVTYYLSATINPILYSIMSLKFRTAFKRVFFNKHIICMTDSSSLSMK